MSTPATDMKVLTMAVRQGLYYNSRLKKLVAPDSFYDPKIKDRILGRTYSSEIAHVTELHRYDDPRYVKFMTVLHRRLSESEALQPMTDRGEWTGSNGVADNFDAMLSVTGVPMQPRGYVSMNSSTERKRYNLPLGFRDEREREVFSFAARAMFSAYVKGDIRIKDGSSSGPPHMVSDRERKIKIATQALANENQIIDLTLSNKMDELRRKCSVVWLAHCGGRLQQEVPSKKRSVISPMTAAYDVADPGYPEYADKSVAYAGLPDNFCAQRARIVVGIPTAINVILAKYLKPYDDVFTKRFPLTFKNRQSDLTASKLNYAFSRLERPDCAFVDVTGYDRTFFAEAHDAVAAVIADAIHPDIGEFYRYAMSCPYYIPATTEEFNKTGTKGYLFGDPNDMIHSRERISFLLSGTFATSINGRLGIFGNHLVLLDYLLGRNLTYEDALAYLSWDKDVFMLNGGDDHAVIGERDLIKAYFDEQFQADHSLFRLDRQPRSIYLGNVYAPLADSPVDDRNMPAKNARFTSYPNISSFIIKTFSPERGYDHRLRRGWREGLKYKLQHYASCPAFGDVMRILDEVHEEIYGLSFSAYVNGLSALSISDADALFMDNPDAIYYKLDPSEVSPELLAAEFVSIPQSQILYDRYHLGGEEWSHDDVAINEKQIYYRKGIL